MRPDRSLGTSRGAEIAAVAELSVYTQLFLIEHPGSARADLDASPAGRLLQACMDAPFPDDLRDPGLHFAIRLRRRARDYQEGAPPGI